MQQNHGILPFPHKQNTPLRRYERNALHLLSLKTPMNLCRFLAMPIYRIEKIINSPEYKHHIIKKKRGGGRHISEPLGQLKKIQKRLNYFLQAYYLCIKPEEVHGFVINPLPSGKTHCNIVTNAGVHTGRKHLLNIDLKDFFPAIPARRIKELFTSPVFNFSEQMAIAFTLLVTCEAKLPAGAPTSPVLSNFVCLGLDAALRLFCREHHLRFTRYADDLTFSSDEFISEGTILEIKELIRRNGFETNEKKVRLESSHHKQTVTGITVNEKVNVDRKRLKKIRAMLHDSTKNGIEAAAQRHFNLTNPPGEGEQLRFIHRLNGYINFVGQVRGKNDPLYRRMDCELQQIKQTMQELAGNLPQRPE
ncbi:MAG: reverse transcriptase family protein [Tannerellaceae bacterium]|jgi:RNA-directed DNA polymerase|nr:reverse transcriptase family protein [Tannerellaceae bacterium]